MADIVYVDKERLELDETKKGALTEEETLNIIVHKKAFTKYIDQAIFSLRASLANMKCVGNEQEIYSSIRALIALKGDLDKTDDNFQKHQNDIKAKNALAKSKTSIIEE